MPSSNISHSMYIQFDECTTTFLIALGNAQAAEIDFWAKAEIPLHYKETMIQLQADFVRICDYLDAKHPVATGWIKDSVTQPQHWDHSLDEAVALATAPDGEIPLRNA